MTPYRALLLTVLIAASSLAIVNNDWSFTALKLWMTTSQPLQAGEAPYHERAGEYELRATALTDALKLPWSFAFLPSGDILVTERRGKLQRLGLASGNLEEIKGLPKVYYKGQGGLLDVALHPDFDNNKLVYLTYSAPLEKGSTTRLARARLQGDQLLETKVLYTTQPVVSSRKHYGGRLLFDGPYLYMTMGERGERDLAQSLGSDLGKVLRFDHDGNPAADNPFVGQPDSRPAIFSYGHRNPQGLARHPATGELWVTEHGPQGGDELNRLIAGANYGWPIITYGEEYGGGKIGEGTRKAGLEQPVYHYVPSIATGALAFYQGDEFAGWQGDAFITALRATHLNHLAIDGLGKITEHRLLTELKLRLRDIKVGPDHKIYLLSEQGSLIKVEASTGGDLTAGQ